MKRLFLLSLLLVGLASPVLADLTIEIVGGQEGAQPIAVVPFGAPEGVGRTMEDLAQVIAADLARTGRFKPLPRQDMPATPQTVEAVDLRDWRVMAMNNLWWVRSTAGPTACTRWTSPSWMFIAASNWRI